MLGRPRLIHREDFSTPTPLNCDYPQDTTNTLPLSDDSSSFSAVMIWLAISHKIQDIISFSANGVFARDYLQVVTVHEELISLQERAFMPSSINTLATRSRTETLRSDLIRMSLSNTVNAVLIAVHRPFIQAHSYSRSAAVVAALGALDLQQSIMDLIPDAQRRLYGPIFSTIEASIFLCGITIDLPSQDVTEERRINQALLQGIERLALVKDRSPLAESGEQVLRQFYQKVQAARRPIIDQNGWSQSDVHQPDTLMEHHSLADFSIPPPYQPFHETYQSLFGRGQSAYAPYSSISSQEPGLGDVFSSEFIDFFHDQGDVI